MYEYLFGVEALPMYGVMLAVGLLAAVLTFRIICTKKKVDDKTYTFYSLLAIISIALGIGGAALFQSVYDMIEAAANGNKVTFGYSGLTFMGGLITGVLVYVIGTLIFAKGKVKRNFFECASYAAPCLVLGHMFGRIGCFCAGCCYGKPTDSFIGIKFVTTDTKVHPTQLYEVIFLAVLFALMMVLLFKYNLYKILLPLYGMAYAVFRFLIEFIRDDDRGQFIPGLSPSQFQVILLFSVAVALALLIYKFNIIPFAKAKDAVPKSTPVSAQCELTDESDDNKTETKTDESETEKTEPKSH